MPEEDARLRGLFDFPVRVLRTRAATTICRCLTIISQAFATAEAKCKRNLYLSSTAGTKHAFQYGIIKKALHVWL